MRPLAIALSLALIGCRDPDKNPPAAVDGDADGFLVEDDCDDADASVYPGADERCDGVDNDCDGAVDDSPVDAPTWNLDGDGDGFGSAAITLTACAQPAGYVDDASDCDDAAPAVHPGAEEADCADPVDYNCDGSVGYADADGDGIPACEDCDDSDGEISPRAQEACDQVDNDCDGEIDEAGAAGEISWYADGDSDGYGDPRAAVRACAPPDGYVADNGDCDDTAAAAHPGGAEVCDGLDNDCDGDVDDDPADARSWYADGDQDGYGSLSVRVHACEAPVGFVAQQGDCDDEHSAVHPDAAEVCDDLDNDCDGELDEDVRATFFLDADGDGYGRAAASTAACEAPPGFVADDTDCDDAHANAFPG
ncbi:MAG: putative metal-binding motif-containing protein, partial [Deltaproteobacteria bacterium]|nr:putative metal-binding motif-containing protein [Deltaproteobacteria bacterium]